MTIKVTVPNTSSDSLTFGSANTPTAAQVVGIDSGSSNGQLAFNTTASGTSVERMRIDASGNLLVGTTTQQNLAKQTVSFATGNNGLVLSMSDNVSAVDFAIFKANGAVCGNIARVGTTSAVSYLSASDYRLKENVQPMTGALAKVKALKPVTYDWKSGGSSEGFIAHELAELCPDAVNGKKDEIDADGNPKHQGIDTSFLVATLTAAIQELKAIVDTQAAKIAALEAK